MYAKFGLMHANLLHLGERVKERLSSERGQGTVEYVSLILVISLVMTGIVVGLKGFTTDAGKGLADAIIGALKKAVKAIDFG